MAGPASSTSSMTSTSQTLTHVPSLGFLSSFTDSSRPNAAAEMRELLESIQSGKRHALLQPTASIPNASLQLAKATLDAYAGQVSDEQQQRIREAKKRKAAAPPTGEVLKVRKLHVEGFESGQVWQQAKRIITSTLRDSQQALQDLQDRNEVETNGVNGNSKLLEDGDDGSEVGSSDEEDEEAEEEDSESASGDASGDANETSEGEDEQDLLGSELEADLVDDTEDIEGLEDEDVDDYEEDEAPSGTFVEDPDGLNDGFFSIEEFNRQSQYFEDQDARADPNTDANSEDEEVDWHADPMSASSAVKGEISKSGKSHEDVSSDMDEDGEDEDGGPTFGDMDLDAPEGESDDEGADEDVDGGLDFNANDVFYKDFFAPPAKKGSKERKAKKVKFSEPAQPDDKDIERAMGDVRRDLFEDESDNDESEDALSDVSAGDPKSRRSAHERRQAKLAEEIRKLEAANVAKREWTLAGEAKAIDRPKNSLLEEDLDFEHIGKPVSVITAAVSESIEEMIKRRILSQEFDELIRRRPESADLSENTRRGLIELDDSKSKQSLAQIYEEEHVKNTNPDTYVSQSDEKLRKEEKEIEQMWKDVSAKLDALSSWHYKPKPAAPALTVVSDVATISMEDAQPTTAQGVSGGDTALAPQEIYKAGKETAERGEIVAKSGLPIAKQELSREDKLRRRRREKERIRKAGGINGQRPVAGKAKERQDTLTDLKKGGVRVINKKGEIVDVDGNKAKSGPTLSSGNYKL